MSSQPWVIHGEPVTLVSHPWCRINDYDVEFANGVRQIRTVHEDGGGAGVLAVTDDDKVVLLDLPHFAVRAGNALVIPGGGLHQGRTPQESAQEELVEETGLVATKWEPIYPFHRFPTLSANVMHLFYATGLRMDKEVEPDPNEVINEVVYLPFEQALTEVGGKITDAAAIIALLWLQTKHLRGE